MFLDRMLYLLVEPIARIFGLYASYAGADCRKLQSAASPNSECELLKDPTRAPDPPPANVKSFQIIRSKYEEERRLMLFGGENLRIGQHGPNRFPI